MALHDATGHAHSNPPLLLYRVTPLTGQGLAQSLYQPQRELMAAFCKSADAPLAYDPSRRRMTLQV